MKIMEVSEMAQISSGESGGHTIVARGRRLHYSEFGSGDPLIMLQGSGPGATGMSNFQRNVDALGEKFRVIVVDFPGFGRSENNIPPGPIFDSLADIVLDFMDALSIPRADFVGNSLGGGTAVCIALKAPDRVRRMVLMGPGGGLPVTSPMPTEGLKRLLTYYDGAPTREKLKGFLELAVFDASAITPALIEERYAASLREDVIVNPPMKGRGIHTDDELWRKPLSSLPHPTLLVWGREDRIIPLDCAFAFLKCIPNAALHVFPRCGHWVQWEKAEAFNTLVLDFLTRA